MVRLDVRFDDDGFRDALTRLRRRVVSLRPVMEEIGQTLTASTQRRFEAEEGPDGRAWEPLAAATLLGRAGKRPFTKRGRLTKRAAERMSQARILRDRGHLFQSITWRATAAEVAVGSNRKYARIHQLGGTAGRGGKTKIPARPFLPVTADGRMGAGDAAAVREIVRDHLAEVLRR